MYEQQCKNQEKEKEGKRAKEREQIRLGRFRNRVGSTEPVQQMEYISIFLGSLSFQTKVFLSKISTE